MDLLERPQGHRLAKIAGARQETCNCFGCSTGKVASAGVI